MVMMSDASDTTRDSVADEEPRPSIAGAISRHVRTADTSWVVAGSLVGGLCAYLFQVVGTRGLGEDAFAPIGVLWTIQYLILSIPMLSLEAWVTREVGMAHDIGRGLRAAVMAMMALAVVVAAVCVTFATALFGGLTDFGVIAGALVLSFGGFVIARGHFAGTERFRAYGMATGGESLLRLLILVAVLAVIGTARGVAWVLPVGPSIAALWWLIERRREPAGGRRAADHRQARPRGEYPHRARADVTLPEGADLTPAEARSGGFLATTTIANAAAQLLLAGGPLFLVALGAGAVEISIFFVTITAARTPLVFAIGGVLSRLLPPLTRVVSRGDFHALRRLTALAVAATVIGALIAAGAAALVGPQVVALFFGEGFRPGRYFVTLTAAAAVLATGNLALNQVMIALRVERHLPAPWVLGLAVAIVLAIALDGSPTTTVITGLLVGEMIVLAGLSLTAVWRSASHLVAGASNGGRMQA